jgi:hypothetical protein
MRPSLFTKSRNPKRHALPDVIETGRQTENGGGMATKNWLYAILETAQNDPLSTVKKLNHVPWNGVDIRQNHSVAFGGQAKTVTI